MVASPFRVAAIQTTPVFLKRKETIEKACDLIAAAGKEGAKLAVFPEAFVPGYPDWIWVLPPHENALLSEMYGELLDQAVSIPGEATQPLCRAAKSANLHLVIGMSERNAEASNTSLYNTLLYIDNLGNILGRHRKLIPTAPERMIWAPGDGSMLDVYDTPFGKLGGLICWENYMPLARYAMFAWGTQMYVAPTWDSGEPWLSTLRHIAKEGRVYVIGCCSAIHQKDIPDRYEFKKSYKKQNEWINGGDSTIVDPDGKILAGPLNRNEGILYAEIEPKQMTGPRWKLDIAGHYARSDVFHFSVDRTPRPIIEVKINQPE